MKGSSKIDILNKHLDKKIIAKQKEDELLHNFNKLQVNNYVEENKLDHLPILKPQPSCSYTGPLPALKKVFNTLPSMDPFDSFGSFGS
jgi:hypothetical protein